MYLHARHAGNVVKIKSTHKLYPSKSKAVDRVVISLGAPHRSVRLSPNAGTPSAGKTAVKRTIQLGKSSCFCCILCEKFLLRVKIALRRRPQIFKLSCEPIRSRDGVIYSLEF